MILQVVMESMADGSQRIGWFDRVFFISIGCFLGYLFGRVQELVRCNDRSEKHAVAAKEKAAKALERLEALEKKMGEKGEAGLSKQRIINGVLVFFTVAVLVFATFRTGATNEMVIGTASELKSTQSCTVEAIAKLTTAVNARTNANMKETEANADLQRAQLRFLTAISTGSSGSVEAEELNNYLTALGVFIKATGKAEGKAEAFPYPKTDDFFQCIEDAATKGGTE